LDASPVPAQAGVKLHGSIVHDEPLLAEQEIAYRGQPLFPGHLPTSLGR
jgi:xanthine dehydrogenase molybdopterin-binding subunit B